MPFSHPPRREPRVLAIARSRTGLGYVVVDPWNVRAAGTCKVPRRSEPLAIRRLIARERPTALRTPDAKLLPALRLAIKGTGLGIVTGELPTLPIRVAKDVLPELALFAPTRALQAVAVQAIAAVLHGNIPTRLYASSRKRALLRTGS